jgi:Flp pilus assembly protein TadG
MLGYIYAIIAVYTAVLMEYVLVLRNEQGASVVLMTLAILLFLVIIGFLFDDRKYYLRFKLHSVAIWGKDLH